jgi:hypothetical protein
MMRHGLAVNLRAEEAISFGRAVIGNNMVVEGIFDKWYLVLTSVQSVEVGIVLSEEEVWHNTFRVRIGLHLLSLGVHRRRRRETVKVEFAETVMLGSDNAIPRLLHGGLGRVVMIPRPGVWEPELWNHM